MPRDAEVGGGLMVAAIQLAVTLGATVGGLLCSEKTLIKGRISLSREF